MSVIVRPTFETPLPTLGPFVCRWIEANCVLGEGDYFGQPFRLRPWQRALLYRLYELVPADRSLRWTDPATWVGLPMRRRYRRALWGFPKGSGKTPLASGVGSVELAGPVLPGGWRNGKPVGVPRTSPLIPIGAASYEQADLVFGDLKTSFEESATLRHVADAFEKEVVLKGRPGRAYRVAAAAGTNDGQRPSVLLADELHEWTGNKERVHLVLANGVSKRENGLVLNITTAGSDLDSLCGRLYTYGRRIEAGLAEDDEFLFVWWEIPEGMDLDDPAELRRAIRLASPAADDFLDVEAVAARYHQIPRFEWERYHGNRWTRADESWLPGGSWESCKVDEAIEFDVDLPVHVGVDMALRNDSVAVVAVQVDEDGKARVRSRIWTLEGKSIDIASVENYLRDLHREHHVSSIAYDPAYFARSAEALEDEGLPMLEFPQSASRMVPACQNAYRLIVDGDVVHDGDPTLTDHVLSAATRETDGGWRLSKGKSRRKIDACIALVIALWEATAIPEEATGPNLW